MQTIMKSQDFSYILNCHKLQIVGSSYFKVEFILCNDIKPGEVLHLMVSLNLMFLRYQWRQT